MNSEGDLAVIASGPRIVGGRALLAITVCALMAPVGQADVLRDLTSQRHWIGYAPRNYNPTIGREPSQAQIRADLEQLHAEGWRSIYTYSVDGVLRHVPRIAKEVGFDYALAGVFYFDDAQLAREKVNGQAELDHIDGFIVGNEGLAFGRYSGEQLLAAMDFFAGLGKPITTTEISGLYFSFPQLLDAGDFVFYNTQPWFNPEVDVTDPAAIARLVTDEFAALQELRPDRPIVIKETWWPTSGNPAATEANQVAFFEALANETTDDGDPVLFSWGEAYDQPWKSEISPFGTLGPDWGFHEQDGTPKQLVAALQEIYTSRVPGVPIGGDYNDDGFVNAADYAVWRDSVGAPAGTLPNDIDGGVIGAAQYNAFVDNFEASAAASISSRSAAVPEPATLASVVSCICWLLSKRGRRRNA